MEISERSVVILLQKASVLIFLRSGNEDSGDEAGRSA